MPWIIEKSWHGHCCLRLRQTFYALLGVGANLPPAQEARENCRQPEFPLKGSMTISRYFCDSEQEILFGL